MLWRGVLLKLLNPWAPTSHEKAQVVSSSRAVLGLQIERWHYAYPPGFPVYRQTSHEGCLLADMGLAAETSAGELLVFDWRMEGFRHGLSVKLTKSEEFSLTSGKTLMVVEELDPSFMKTLGSRVAEVQVVWHASDSVAADSLWAVRLGFENGGQAALVLADWDETESSLVYRPDCVALIHNTELADQYLHSEEGAGARFDMPQQLSDRSDRTS